MPTRRVPRALLESAAAAGAWPEGLEAPPFLLRPPDSQGGHGLARIGTAAELATLRGAVEGFDLALEIRTRDSMPANWAMTQNNRAAALQSLSERLGGDEGLQALRGAVELIAGEV